MPSPENDDGRTFAARQGTAAGSVSGSFNVLHQTLADVANDAKQSCVNHKASYRVVRANFMALSCQLPSGKTFYTRSLTRGDEDVIASFEFSYPVSENAVWDQVVTRMSRSFQPTLGR